VPLLEDPGDVEKNSCEAGPATVNGVLGPLMVELPVSTAWSWNDPSLFNTGVASVSAQPVNDACPEEFVDEVVGEHATVPDLPPGKTFIVMLTPLEGTGAPCESTSWITGWEPKVTPDTEACGEVTNVIALAAPATVN